MQAYNKILIWENDRRLKSLYEFRNNVVSYFNNCIHHMFGEEPEENDVARKIRIDVNKGMAETLKIMTAAGVSPVMLVTPPPIIGGSPQIIDVVLNVFHLHNYHLRPQDVIDYLERTIGIYEKNRRAAKLRTVNPFFYLGRIFDRIAEFPFFLVGQMGFDRAKAETSIIGRIIKGIIQLITVLAAVLTVLYLLGYLEPVKIFIRSLFEKR